MHWHAPDCPPEILEAFLENVIAFEEAPRSSLMEKLAQEGCETPPPDAISDADLPAKILEIARCLAKRGFYLERTDHLSDRQLYVKLCAEVLVEEYGDVPENEGCWHLDLLGGGSLEDIQDHLRYYADDLSRADWKTEFPDFEIPKRERRPFDRDRTLPRPPL